MAKRKVEKELTIEEQLKRERERELNYIEDRVQHFNEPTYKFQIGKKVSATLSTPLTPHS